MRSAIVVGDTGGNAIVLADCLYRAGVRGIEIPQDRVILHVGDFVRCQPQFRIGNGESIRRVAALARANPESYIQLLGNHESAALGGPARASWNVDASLSTGDRRHLENLWSDGQLRLAHVLETTCWGRVLITHAGLTRGRWVALGAPMDPRTAATLINRDIGKAPVQWARAGSLVCKQDLKADTTWAEVNEELDAPWISAGDAPFSQIHGHAAPFNWRTNMWWPDAPSEVQARTYVDHENHRTITQLALDRVAVSVDWNLGDDPNRAEARWPLLRLQLTE